MSPAPVAMATTAAIYTHIEGQTARVAPAWAWACVASPVDVPLPSLPSISKTCSRVGESSDGVLRVAMAGKFGLSKDPTLMLTALPEGGFLAGLDGPLGADLGLERYGEEEGVHLVIGVADNTFQQGSTGWTG